MEAALRNSMGEATTQRIQLPGVDVKYLGRYSQWHSTGDLRATDGSTLC
jgi:hypothetical protein